MSQGRPRVQGGALVGESLGPTFLCLPLTLAGGSLSFSLLLALSALQG